MLLSDGSLIMLSPGSRIRISQYSYAEGENRRTAVVNVKTGALHLIITDSRSAGSRITIETGQAIAVTALANIVVVAAPEKTTIATLDGWVSVCNRTNVVIGSVSVSENLMTVVTTKEPPTVPSFLSQQQRRIYTKDARFF